MKLSDSNGTASVFSFGHIDLTDSNGAQTYDPNDLPILPTRNLVLFPGVTIPIKLVRENSLQIAEIAKKNNLPIGVVCQLNPEEESPTVGTLCNYGVFARVLQVIKLPDGTNTAIVQAGKKFKITGEGISMSIPQAELSVSVKEIREPNPKRDDTEFAAICDAIRTSSENIAKGVQQQIDLDVIFNMGGTPPNNELINLIATHAPIDIDVKMNLLAIYRLKERATALYEALVRQEEMLHIAENVNRRARESFDDQQRRIFLQRQMEAIDQELNGDNDDASKFRERAEKLNLSEKVRKHIEKEINKLERLSPQTPDYSVQYTYLETLTELPWGIETIGNPLISDARQTLDDEHYGLRKIKERILEQLAVILHSSNRVKAPIICLVGPPGVGKTSLGQSIAHALDRKFQRVSLGGLHDEAEIRGHRRTYIGAMPGRIIDAIRRAETSNPVILLDEVDKIGQDYKGDPSSALLEVLDPEQNCHFHDNYIDIDFDLSNVIFIATANTLNGVSQPLIDRMEVIELSGYLLEEKREIARRHLIPKICRELDFDESDFKITDDAISAIIDNYTAESGVRQLEKALSSIARKIILRKCENEDIPEAIDAKDLESLLGLPKYNKEKYEGNDYAGVVTGLAWTAAGGEILYIESSLSKGKGERLTLTGNLGDVMKESATIALQYVKAHAAKLGIDPELFANHDLHIHVPEGAIPKDGPSAGITMATSIASAFTNRKVRLNTAMTGEITLRGKVLPVGGIKEKILAAKRAGITDIILSAENRKDVEEIDEKYREGLTFHYVTTVSDVLAIALTDELAKE